MEGLRAYGFTDAEIFDAAARCFFSKFLDALRAEPDSAYLELEALDRLNEVLLSIPPMYPQVDWTLPGVAG